MITKTATLNKIKSSSNWEKIRNHFNQSDWSELPEEVEEIIYFTWLIKNDYVIYYDEEPDNIDYQDVGHDYEESLYSTIKTYRDEKGEFTWICLALYYDIDKLEELL